MAMIGDTAITSANDAIWLERYLIAIESELKHGTSLLGQLNQRIDRLIGLEEERRDAERHMEALATALMPNTEPTVHIDAEQLDWYRTREGEIRVREADGERAATAAEAHVLGRRSSQRRSR